MAIIDLALVLAQVGTPTPTPDSLDVHLVRESRDWWRDLITPGVTLVAALAGGVGGVVIGGKMNRRTLSDLEKERESREERLDKAREEREKALELDRERRAIDADKRRAIGALRMVRTATVDAMHPVIASFGTLHLGMRVTGPCDLGYDRTMSICSPRG